MALVEVIGVAALAGFVQGLSGFAFGLVAAALWAWTMEPRVLVPMVVLGSLTGQLFSIRHVRTSISSARVMPFLVGGVVGTPLGIAILHSIDVVAFRTCVGIGLVLYCTVMLLAKTLPSFPNTHRTADAGVGLVAGIMGGASGLSGPPMILWCAMRGWAPAVQRATFQTYFITVQVLMLALLALQGAIDRQMLAMLALVAPAVILSARFGARLSQRFSQAQFRRGLFGLLLALGVLLATPWVHSIVRLALSG